MRRSQRTLAWFVAGSGTAGWAAALICVIVSLVRTVLVFSNMVLTQTLVPSVILGSILMLLGLFWVVPLVMRSLGIRVRNRMPQKIRRWCQMRSLADHLYLLRIAVMMAMAPPVFVLLANRVSSLNSGAPPASQMDTMIVMGWVFFPIGWGMFAAAGWLLLNRFLPAYRSSHDREMRRSLRAHYRGVALRSFIAPFDNQQKTIYQSCRLSARIAKLHRSVILCALGCLSAASCSAAMTPSEHYIGEALALLTLIAISLQWPTGHKIVRWSGKLLDPFCADCREYKEY